MSTKFWQLTGMLFWIIGLLTACVAPPIPSVDPRGQAAQPAATAALPLKVGVLPFLSNAIFTIADKEGYFAEQGLAVEWIPLKSDNDAIPMLLKGDLDVATPALTAGLFNAIAQSGSIRVALPLTSFTAQECAYIGMLIRRSDIDAGHFTAPAQWKGARVTLPPAGVQSTSGYVLDQALHQGGLTLQDITLAPADLPAQEAALAAGQTDLIYAVEPWITRMLANEELKLLMPLEPTVPNLTVSVIAFGARPLADPAIGERFAVAYLKAVRQYIQGKTERNVELVAAHTKLEPQLVEKLCWPVVSPDGNINVDSIIGYQTWLKEQGLLDRSLTADEFMDTRFVTSALQSIGNAKP